MSYVIPRKLPVTKEQRMENMVKKFMPGNDMGESTYVSPVDPLAAPNKKRGAIVFISDVEPVTAEIGDFWLEM